VKNINIVVVFVVVIEEIINEKLCQMLIVFDDYELL
jgi:hypothetical protein